VSTRAVRIPADQARSRLIEAANSLLRGRRYRDVRIEDVTREAGLARTVFYRHFDGMAALILGVLEDLLSEIVEEGEESDPDDRDQVHRMLALVVRTFREHGHLMRALDDAARIDAAAEAATRAFHERAIDVSVELVQRGVDRGHTPAMPVADVVRALANMNVQYLLDLVALEPEFDEDAALEALWTVWRRTTWPQDD
jgi:AcrR family transcriptional regulator